MATTTTTSVVQVTVFDIGGYTKTYNLDNPKPNLTLNQIKNAFKIAIDGGWLLGNNLDPVIEVRSANYSEAIKTSIDGAEIEVTPASAEITTSSVNFTITGGSVTSTNIADSNVTANPTSSSFYWKSPEISDDGSIVNVGYTVTATQSSTFTGTATLELFIGTNKLIVPLTVNVSVEPA